MVANMTPKKSFGTMTSTWSIGAIGFVLGGVVALLIVMIYISRIANAQMSSKEALLQVETSQSFQEIRNVIFEECAFILIGGTLVFLCWHQTRKETNNQLTSTAATIKNDLTDSLLRDGSAGTSEKSSVPLSDIKGSKSSSDCFTNGNVAWTEERAAQNSFGTSGSPDRLNISESSHARTSDFNNAMSNFNNFPFESQSENKMENFYTHATNSEDMYKNYTNSSNVYPHHCGLTDHMGDLERDRLEFFFLMKRNDLVGAGSLLYQSPGLSKRCYQALIRAHCKMIEPTQAEHWFVIMQQQEHEQSTLAIDVQLMKALVHSYAKENMPEKAEQWLNKLIKINCGDIVSFSVVINSFGKVGNVDHIEALVHSARYCGFELNRIIYSTIINACAKVGNVERAERWFEDMIRSSITPDQIIWNTMIKTCARAGSVEKVHYWLEKMKRSGCEGNILTYTAVIQVSSKVGDVELGKACLKEMKELGLKPDQIVYNSLLYGCEVAGDVTRAEEIVEILEAEGMELDRIGYRSILRAIAKRTGDSWREKAIYWSRRMRAKGFNNLIQY